MNINGLQIMNEITEPSLPSASLWCCLLLPLRCVQGRPSFAGKQTRCQLVVSWWTPLSTMHTILCDHTSSSLTFSSAVFCASVRWLLISSFDLRMNLNNTQASVSLFELYSPRHNANYAGCLGDSHASNSFVQPCVVRQQSHFRLGESSMFLNFSELIDLQVC